MSRLAIPSIDELICQCQTMPPLMQPRTILDLRYTESPIAQNSSPSGKEDPGTNEESKKKGTWTQEEDEILLRAVYKYGTVKWGTVSKCVKGRAPNQCKERWFFRLAPDLKKTPFEEWEDALIVFLRSKYGNHWTLISSNLPGRSSCSVKNRWYTVLRKKCEKMRSDITADLSHFSKK
jgi:hypothetical protein